MVGSTAMQCNFAIVQQVTIESIDDRNVSFTTRASGPSGCADQNLRKTFTVPLAEVYARPIAGALPPVEMIPGATGNLYLSRNGWQIVSDGGFKIHGCGQALFKFPECGAIATPPLTRLTVIPTSIIVRGHLPDETTFFDIELAGPDAAESQDIVWNGADYIELHLTARGARRMGRGSHAQTVKLWPTKIRIKGSPAIDQAVLGEIDVLDPEMAACNQHIEFGRRGAPVTLRLTQDGVNAFHVTPQAVLESSSTAVSDAPSNKADVAASPSGHGTGHHLPRVTRGRSPG
jgi:hypothetical protein